MIKKTLLIFAVFIVGIACLYFFWNYFFNIYSLFFNNLPRIEREITDLIEEKKELIYTPPPLRTEKDNPDSYLTKAGVIQWTNNQRVKYGLPPLKENAFLNASAEEKVKDMFQNQYFAHQSLSGLGVGDLADEFGYQFIAIGENLALGNFKNDEALVQAWMDSQGHKENILNENYQEIGVSVIKGTFEGKTTWLAVQHFGRPLSACPAIDEFLKLKIESLQKQIDATEDELNDLKNEIAAIKPKRGPIYNQKIEEYNNLVYQYNALIEELKILVNQYNNQVKTFNECVGSI